MNKKQKLIMVVDDEIEIRNIINDILVEEGYKSIVASSANEARQLLIKHTPDLVFLDIWMPKEDGITLLKEWAKDQSKQFPVIMISGHATIETAIKATKLGAADFIEKPISIENLFGAIDKVFSEQNQEESADILSYIINNNKKFSDIFRATIVDITKADITFLIGEEGTEKEAWAKYLHFKQFNSYSNFYVFQLNLFNVDFKDEEEFEHQLIQQINKLSNAGIFFEGLHLLDLSEQTIVKSILKKNKERGLNYYISLTNKELIEGLQSTNNQTINIPPLRRYLHDIPELSDVCVQYFIQHEDLTYRRFSLAAQNMLTKYSWPGNLQQLIDMVHALLVRKDKEIINVEEIEETLTLQGPKGNLLIESTVMTLSMKEAKKQFERAFLTRQLELVGGKISELARRVDMERTNLYRKLQSLGIQYKKK
jgi:DNA-binding NtrC family response regulator